MNIRLGLQTITWGDPQDHLMDEILGTAATCGYEGVEIGWRRIEATGVDRLRMLLEKHGLELFASHVGGNLMDLSQASHERQEIDGVLEGLVRLGATRLLYSGIRYKNDEQLNAEIASLNAAVERCAERGVGLLYHNHDFEFTDGGRAFEALVNDTAIKFCPDVGWLHKAGVDCVAVLDRLGERVASLHFKEFLTTTPGLNDFCELGNGCVPFDAVAAWATDRDVDDFWVVAEQDSADGPASDAAAVNARFLKTCLNRAAVVTSEVTHG